MSTRDCPALPHLLVLTELNLRCNPAHRVATQCIALQRAASTAQRAVQHALHCSVAPCGTAAHRCNSYNRLSERAAVLDVLAGRNVRVDLQVLAKLTHAGLRVALLHRLLRVAAGQPAPRGQCCEHF